MSSVNENQDLSADAQDTAPPAHVSGAGGVQALDQDISEKGTSVNLDKQILFQRKIAFYGTLSVCISMFFTFGWYFFHSHFFRILIATHSYATALAMALLIIPSFLLWGLVRAVYKVGGDSDKTIDVVIKEMRKIHPTQ